MTCKLVQQRKDLALQAFRDFPNASVIKINFAEVVLYIFAKLLKTLLCCSSESQQEVYPVLSC